MFRYIIMGKYSSDFLAGMMHNPQDRKKATETMSKKAGLEYADGESYLHINHPDYDFICIMYGKNVLYVAVTVILSMYGTNTHEGTVNCHFMQKKSLSIMW